MAIYIDYTSLVNLFAKNIASTVGNLNVVQSLIDAKKQTSQQGADYFSASNYNNTHERPKLDQSGFHATDELGNPVTSPLEMFYGKEYIKDKLTFIAVEGEDSDGESKYKVKSGARKEQVTITVKYSKGKAVAEEVIVENESGEQIIIKAKYHSFRKPSEITINKRDKHGLNNSAEKINYSYDENGNLKTIVVTTQRGYSSEIKLYDNKGNLMQNEIVNSEGRLRKRENYINGKVTTSEEYRYHGNGAIAEINKEENTSNSKVTSTLRFDENGNYIYLRVVEEEIIGEVEKVAITEQSIQGDVLKESFFERTSTPKMEVRKEEVCENGKIIKREFIQYREENNNETNEYYTKTEEFYSSGYPKRVAISDSRNSAGVEIKFSEDGKILEQKLDSYDSFGNGYHITETFGVNGQLMFYESIMAGPLGAMERLLVSESKEFYEDGKIKKHFKGATFGENILFDETIQYDQNGKPLVEK